MMAAGPTMAAARPGNRKMPWPMTKLTLSAMTSKRLMLRLSAAAIRGSLRKPISGRATGAAVYRFRSSGCLDSGSNGVTSDIPHYRK